jgi:hypothetical protein
MNRKQLIEQILYHLTHLRVSVEQYNGLNLQDINIHSENFFRDLLNLVFDYSLKNINILQKNAQSIDLGDEIARIAIQVTSTSELGKIRHTYNGFISAKLDKKYDRLIVLIIGQKPGYRIKSFGGAGNFSISLAEDVWDFPELLKKIGDLSLVDLQRCRDFLRAELVVAEPRQSNEVRTLVRLIQVLSTAEEISSEDDLREDPDPERKIHDRFADHAVFLEEQFVNLHEIYGRTLKEVNKHSDLGHVRVRKLQVYLMIWSNRVLTQHGGDPEKALDDLVSKILQMMGSSDGDFDEGAIRYYLIHQLIACSVFPNKRIRHA